MVLVRVTKLVRELKYQQAHYPFYVCHPGIFKSVEQPYADGIALVNQRRPGGDARSSGY